MADAHFEEPRLAQVYDPLGPDRGDLEVYAAIVEEFGARTVLDVGCGTGTLGCLLAGRGVDVVGVDPAGASLRVARAKPGADRVRWYLGDAATLRFRGRDEIADSLRSAGFVLDEVRDAPDRPGLEMVFVARRPA
jgi:ubiquinone/menaquinone biosynthesis C-methylase UbiE